MQIEFSNIHRVENKSHLQVFREINVPSDLIVEMLISETFREKMVRVNFRKTLCCGNYGRFDKNAVIFAFSTIKKLLYT